MAVVRTIKKRGVSMVVEAHAEVLFMPGGKVHNWQDMFSQRIRARTIAAAPSNKRPRWAHYGKPLKSTFVSAYPKFWGNGKDKQRVYGAVASKSPYALYVDQGTGIYGGGGPYPAKILPPWTVGGASLYEATWRPSGPGGRKVAPVMIKGQKGQEFMAAGLAAAFRSMRMRAFQLPGTIPQISNVLGTTVSGVDNLLDSARSDGGAFKAQLKLWREWRDDAWGRGEGLGRGGGIGSRSHQRFMQTAAEAREARLAEQGKGRAAYEASKAAAERRKKAQIARLLEEKRRREEAQRRQAEADRRRAEQEAKALAVRDLRAGNAQMKREATEFYRLIKMQYPDATLTSATLAEGVILYRVRYTAPGGRVITESWAYGYNTD